MAITSDGGSYNLENIKTGMYRLTAESGMSLTVKNVKLSPVVFLLHMDRSIGI